MCSGCTWGWWGGQAVFANKNKSVNVLIALALEAAYVLLNDHSSEWIWGNNSKFLCAMIGNHRNNWIFTTLSPRTVPSLVQLKFFGQVSLARKPETHLKRAPNSASCPQWRCLRESSGNAAYCSIQYHLLGSPNVRCLAADYFCNTSWKIWYYCHAHRGTFALNYKCFGK